MNLLARLKQKVLALRHESDMRLAYSEGRLDDALACARQLYDFNLENAWANYLLACHHLESERYAEALPHLEHAATEWPEDSRIHFAIGLCYDDLEQPRKAIKAYETALILAPGWNKAAKNIGRDLYLLGDYPAAERALRHYCAAAPDDKEAHDLLGYVCYRQGKLTASYAHYARARSLDPLNPKLERNACLLYSRSATS